MGLRMSGRSRLLGMASGVVPECSPPDTVEAAARGGFDAVGLWVEPDIWTDETTRQVRRRLADTGLTAIDVEVIWIKPGPLDPAHKRILDIGAEVGARNALAVSSDPDLGATIEKYAALCEHAGSVGIRLALEFGLFTEVKTISAARHVLDTVNHPASSLLVDPLHLIRSGGSAADVGAVPAHLFSYAQFCDAPGNGPTADDPEGILREALDERLQLGDGGLPLRDILAALPADLPLSIELRSKPLRDAYPDPAERARATADASRRFLDACAREA